MTAALTTAPATSPGIRLVTVRPAPRREPLFDDELPRHLHVVGEHDQPLPFVTAPPAEPGELAVPSVRAGLPDPARWGRRLLICLIETASGRRPLQQLSGLLSHSVAHGLGTDFERCAQAGRRHWTQTAVVASVRATEPADGVAELCATLRVGGRLRAVAMRLELQSGRWRCTRLQLG